MIVWFLCLLGLYLAFGFLFAIYFAVSGVVKLDKAARGTSVFFRVLIVPGAMALWPYLLMQLVRGGESPRDERNAHRDIAAGTAR
jgi:hypothetical protein